MQLRKLLWHLGYRYPANVKSLLDGYNWAEKKLRIKRNRAYWISKIERNMQRDEENNRKLRGNGWKVYRFWQHEIKRDMLGCIKKVIIVLHEFPSR